MTSSKHEPADPEARTAAGRVRGRHEGGLAVFRGIPFAGPPTGPARFAAPQPATPWDGVRDASAFGSPPPQSGTYGPAPAPADDDWLTVNVWTPAPDPAAPLPSAPYSSALRPVLVWIYGGAYKVGSSDAPGYDGGRLAREGEQVVVTFNYRTGVEGFAQIQGAPANRGLLDQVAALRWVRDNIAAFGGDPDLVTVFGQSAGAGSVASLLATPLAAGLFRRAIAQSAPGIYYSAPLAADIAAAIAAELGLRATTADLSGVDPVRLVAAADAVDRKLGTYHDRWGQVAHTSTPFAPVVDGEVLPATPWQALAAGAGRDVALIAGHNRDECRLFLAMSGQLGTISDEQAARSLRALGPGRDGEQAYRAAFPGASAESLYELVQNDWVFRMPTLHLAQAQTAGGGVAYLYELAWSAPANGGILGACHGLDGPLVFGNLDEGFAARLIGPAPYPAAEEVSAQFRTAWTRFAATGDPGWPAYDPREGLTRVFDLPPAVTPYPEETSRRLWQDHFSPLPLPLTA
jgi:para-nitrobenzyl esterase